MSEEKKEGEMGKGGERGTSPKEMSGEGGETEVLC